KQKEKSEQPQFDFGSKPIEEEQSTRISTEKFSLAKPPIIVKESETIVDEQKSPPTTVPDVDVEHKRTESRHLDSKPLDETQEIQQDKVVKTSTTERVPTMYPIGQLQGTYILAQNENGLYMI